MKIERRTLVILAVVVGVVIIMGTVGAATLERLSQSSAAKRLGIDNTPKGIDRDRLLSIARFEEPMLKILRTRFPNARVTSGYRNEEVNKAVGGVPTSRHRLGLAFDFGGLGGHKDTRVAARLLFQNLDKLPAPQELRAVLAEVDHVHIEFYDPFRRLETSEQVAARGTRWLQEEFPRTRPKKFVRLGVA